MVAPAPIEISTDVLRKLHRIHQQRSDLSGQLRRGPLQLQAVQATIAEAQANVDAIAATLKKTRMLADEKQLQLKSREDQVSKLRGRLNVAATNKEFTLLKDQIAADEQANSVQNDEIFEILERIDEITQQLDAAKAELRAREEEAVEKTAAIEQRIAQVTEELQRVNEQLVVAETQIPLAAKSDYDRIVAARGEEALAPIEDESCGNCCQTLTAQLLDQVTLSKLVHCPNCNAFLYLAEDRRVR